MKRLVIKPGAAEFLRVGSKMDGFDVTRHILDTLVSKGLATTTDCCTYTLAGGGGGATNLTMTRNATTVTIASDTGTDAVIPAADGTNAGLMVPAQFNKLGFITITQAVDLDAAEADIADLTTLSGVASNATNLGAFDAAGNAYVGNPVTMKQGFQNLATGMNTAFNLVGAGANASTLGTFTGTTIPDSQTVKQALQALETAVEGASTITTAQITPTGSVEAANMTVRYIGATPPTLAMTAGTWTLNMAGSELLSADIYIQDGDNPGANLTLNINSTSSVKNQDITTLYIPHVLGVNLGAGAGSLPADYNATTGPTNLLTRINTTPSNGDIQLLLQNFTTTFGTGAVLLKLLW